MGVTAIIQARMGSTRLPGKSLRLLAGKPVVMHVVDRALATPNVDSVIVATTTNSEDDPLVEMLSSRDIPVFRGSEHDVLLRYTAAALVFGGDPIVRLTGDDPLKDPAVIAIVIAAFLQDPARFDYVSNTIRPTFPEGQDTEVIRAAALFESNKSATEPYDREHVTPYLYKHPEKYRCFNVTYEQDLSHMRWTLDEECDFRFFEAIFSHFDNEFVSLPQVLALLRKKPEIMQINQSVKRSDRYMSLDSQVSQ